MTCQNNETQLNKFNCTVWLETINRQFNLTSIYDNLRFQVRRLNSIHVFNQAFYLQIWMIPSVPESPKIPPIKILSSFKNSIGLKLTRLRFPEGGGRDILSYQLYNAQRVQRIHHGDGNPFIQRYGQPDSHAKTLQWYF